MQTLWREAEQYLSRLVSHLLKPFGPEDNESLSFSGKEGLVGGESEDLKDMMRIDLQLKNNTMECLPNEGRNKGILDFWYSFLDPRIKGLNNQMSENA